MKLKPLPKLKVFAFFFFLSFFCFANGGKRSVNGVLFSIGGVPHTLKEVRFFLALREFKEGRDPLKKLEEVPSLIEAGQQLALDLMVLSDMKDILSVKKEDGDFRKLAKDKRGSFEKVLSFLKQNESQAFKVMDHRYEAQNLLQKKIGTLTPIISSHEIEKFFKNHSDEYVNQSLVQVSNLIAEKLRSERTQNALRDWVNSLKQKNQYLFFGDYLQ